MEMFENLKKKNLLVVTNDAGGANQIYYFLKLNKISFSLCKRTCIRNFQKKK